MTAADARTHPQRSLVIDALDGDPDRRPPAVTPVAARAGDRLLLCSDGLSDALDNVSVIVADVASRRGPGAGWR